MTALQLMTNLIKIQKQYWGDDQNIAAGLFLFFYQKVTNNTKTASK